MRLARNFLIDIHSGALYVCLGIMCNLVGCALWASFFVMLPISHIKLESCVLLNVCLAVHSPLLWSVIDWTLT